MASPRPDQAELFGPPPARVTQPLAPARPAPARATSRTARVKPRAGEDTVAGGSFAEAVEVAVSSHADLLSYGLPPPLSERVHVGSRVTVPLRGRLVVGVVFRRLAVGDLAFDPARLRPVVACPDEPQVPADLLQSLEFIARYYHCPLGAAVRMALPAVLRHTGVDGDDAPERLQPWVGSTGVRPWPDGLTRMEVRILQRVEAEGALLVTDLRRKGLEDRPPAAPLDDPDRPPPRTRAVPAPQAVLESLAERGLVRLWHERVLRDPLGMRTPVPQDQPPVLTEGQRGALEALWPDLQAKHFGGHLLRGVTGSGKTEVYLHLIAAALEQGRGAIVLVPEIALTPQLVQRFRARFGDQVAALHSGMTDGERYDQYSQIQSRQRRIVVGPRSALFAPVHDLGVIVVDECHDSSFKQAAGVRYHARDVALVRARAAQAVCLLGSATPGCEEMALCSDGRLRRTELTYRALGGQLPVTQVVDLRTCERLADPDDDRPSLLSAELAHAITETVGRGEQVMLLHNRRGFATTMICRSCGVAVECTDCAIALTWHRGQGRLRCHYCDYSVPADISCPQCRGRNLLGVGAGTERIEQTLERFAPGLRIQRFDRDTASGQRLLDTLDRFRRRELDVLVGTQMLAKGHDFPAVTLVGVLLAESGLRVPDFRAAERTFQLLTQVAGRAGRGDRPGRVLVQTYQPEHPAILAALRQDHDAFLQLELKARQETGYPPFAYLALLETRHEDENKARAAMELLVQDLRDWGAEVRGPVAAGVARLRGIHRVHALLRSTERKALHGWLHRLRVQSEPKLPSGIEFALDVDPYGFG